MNCCRRGFSLVELVAACLLGAIVLAAGVRLTLAVRRYWRAEQEAVNARSAVRTTAAVLAAELRATAPAHGDLLRVSDTAVTLRSTRGVREVCAAAIPGSAEIVVRDDAGLATGVLQPGRDSVLVFLPDDVVSADRWFGARIVAVVGGTCAAGERAARLRLAVQPAVIPILDSVAPGALVRAFQTLTYRLYDDGSGTFWFGVRSWQGSAWAATSPIAGPLRPRDGLGLRFLDANGGAAPADSTRAVGIAVRAAPLPAGSARAESLLVIVAPRTP